MQSEVDGTFVINARDQLEVRDYMGKRYACLKFERTGKDGKTHINRMNFDKENWTKLVNDQQQTPPKTPVKVPPKAVKRKRTDNKEKCKRRLFENIPIIATITQYSWQYGKEQSPLWYFTEEMCRKSADFAENQADIVISTRQIPTPSMTDITTMITTHLVVAEIRQRMSQKCYGCQVDHPSQIQHMGFGGCMDEWESSVDHYYDEAFAFIKPEDVWDASVKIMDVLTIPVMADAITTVTDVRNDVMQMNIISDYELLINNVLN